MEFFRNILRNHSVYSAHDPRIARRAGIYFAAGAGGGATVSLCCAQAPSPKPVARTATIMIILRNFNLSRLLSSQVAPLRLGGESRRSNAFLHFFEPTQIGRADLFCVAGGQYFLLLLCTSSNPTALRLLSNQRAHLRMRGALPL